MLFMLFMQLARLMWDPKTRHLFRLFRLLARLTLVYPYDSNMAVGRTSRLLGGRVPRQREWRRRGARARLLAGAAEDST